ncbi:MAG: PSD1 and planctomycete cytochrome C domain-containing protein [Pirellulales bacterium]
MHHTNLASVFRWLTVLSVLVLFRPQLLAQNSTVDYQRDIQPIFAEHCLHCHGADASSRKGELRLDDRDATTKGGESGKAAIVSGKPSESLLIERILTADADEVMPPPSEKKPLSDRQKELLGRWIEEGANFSAHWAFSPITAENLPNNGPSHPIDQFVKRELDRRGLQASPHATSAELCRRIYLDILGLPPSPEDFERFEKEGLEATVDRLLKSDRYGEKWARHWLDTARYSDTNGYEKDLRRDQWAWRDWVITALNQDMPYDQFLIEQLAGDLIPDAKQSQKIATGFLRNSMLNEEGAIVPEQFRMFEMFDRMDCIGKSILGITTQCAQCHNHKFDPLTMDEYYGMMSYLNNSYEAQSWVYTDEQIAKRAQVQAKVKEIYDAVRAKIPDWQAKLNTWSTEVVSKQAAWTSVAMHQLESVSGLNHPVQLADQSILMLGHSSGDVFYVGTPAMQNITGLRLEILNHGDLPFTGPGRSSIGTWDISEIEVFVQAAGKTEWEKQKLVNASADYSNPDKKLDGKKSTGPVTYLIDGTDETTWEADRGTGLRNQPSAAVVQFEKALEYPEGSKFKFVMRMGKMVGCCRVSLTRDATPTALPIDYAAIQALARPTEQRTALDSDAIFAAWTASLETETQTKEDLKKAWSEYPGALTSVMHMAERESSFERPTHLLNRGEWDQPRTPATRHTPAFLHKPQQEVRTRLDFARWIASKDSPLTARVAVNRVWQAMFGEGLVETAEDFGTRTAVPEHLSVLNWLSAEFMRQGWSQKQLIKTIIMSDTYRQTSHVTADRLEKDPRNRLLSRGPRFRCEAEVMRDIALAVSGLLTDKFGGPSVIPPVPQNVLDYNYVYPSYWTPAQGAERYRRAVYMFRKRSMPDPVMSNLDAPNGDLACARRVRSNTPLAALTGLNETIFVEAAQALSLRILKEAGKSDAERIERGYRLCTGRLPTQAERDALLSYLDKTRKRIADGWLNAREISTGEAGRLPALPEGVTPQDAAAWTLTARVLLNLDETISKN